MTSQYIPTNFSIDEIVNMITMDPNATERERSLVSRLDEQGDLIEEKDAEIARLDDQISSLESDIQVKDNEIERQEQKIADLKDEIAELEANRAGA